MAERAALLTANLQTKPSVFEVIAQESLSATVHPALKKLATFLAIYNPHSLGWLVKWYEETYLTLNTLLQYYYLKHHASTFAEAFYGLRRIPVPATNPPIDKLSQKQQILSLVCVVLLPYLKSKIDAKIDQKKLEIADRSGLDNSKDRYQRYILNVYNVVNASYHVLNIAHLIAYLSNASLYHSTLIRLCGLSLDYVDNNPEVEKWSWMEILSGKLGFTSIMGGAIIRGVEIGAFFMQFLQWWDSERFKLDVTSLPTPPPPELDACSDKYRGKCPICLQQWKVPTALQVSGYVFCYRCIVTHLQTNSLCPITKYPANAEDLIRIFETGSL